MSKCTNKCADPAEINISWPTSRGRMSVNFCGVCAASWWQKYQHTESGLCAILGGVKSDKELAEDCAEYEAEYESA